MILDCTRTRKRAFRGVSPHNPPVTGLRQDWRQLNTEAGPYGAASTSPDWPFREYNFSSVLHRVKEISPACRAFLRHVEDAEDLACAIPGGRQHHIERLCRHRLAAMNLDVHAVHEHYGIVFFETTFKPPVDLRAYTFNHTAYAGLGVMLTVYPVEDFGYLLLRKSLDI